MTFDTFKNALKIVEDYGDTLSLGGGEPTVHPEFWQFLGYALSKQLEGPLWLATNGKRTDDALALAGLAKKGAISCALSQDQWHDGVEPKVVQAFTRPEQHAYASNSEDYREIRTIKEPYRAGRWKKGLRCCVCTDLVVQPDGSIHQCGCMDSPVVGHVRSGKIKSDAFTHECWKPEEDRKEYARQHRHSQQENHET
jgi:MoaA/NifB/PqqE/SkfB family radical SAM enzyme